MAIAKARGQEWAWRGKATKMADGAGASEGGAAGEGLERAAAGRPCRVHEFIASAVGTSPLPGGVNGVRAAPASTGLEGCSLCPYSVTAHMAACGLRSYKGVKTVPKSGPWEPVRRHQDVYVWITGFSLLSCHGLTVENIPPLLCFLKPYIQPELLRAAFFRDP